MVESSEKSWAPLESDPNIFSGCADALGFPSIMWSFQDVFGFEAENWNVFIP